MFDSFNGDFDIQKEHINNCGEYVVTSGLTDDGILGKSDVNAKIFDNGTITVDMFGNVFYRQFKYKIVTHARVFSLKPKMKITDNQGLFISNALFFLKFSYGYENMCSWEKIKTKQVQLPCRNGNIDFDFMEKFIAEPPAQRIAELEAYLSVTGLKDTCLSPEEEQALREYDNVNWGKFRMGELFERISTKKLPFKADDLPKQITDKYTLPCLTSSFRNQGLNYFAPRENATILKNVVSIPSNSDVYRAYYQSNEFTVLSDAYTIHWTYDNKQLLPSQYLYAVACINKVTDLPVYSYKNKLGGWNVVQNKNIQLPIKNDKPDYNYMKVLISAIQKLVIKDVVLYADRKINATKAVINK